MLQGYVWGFLRSVHSKFSITSEGDLFSCLTCLILQSTKYVPLHHQLVKNPHDRCCWKCAKIGSKVIQIQKKFFWPYLQMPTTQLISIFWRSRLQNKAKIPVKTRVIWVLGGFYFSCRVMMLIINKSHFKHIQKHPKWLYTGILSESFKGHFFLTNYTQKNEILN